MLKRFPRYWLNVTQWDDRGNFFSLHQTLHRGSVATLVATPTLWLALAALCVLHPDHPDQLTSHAAHLLRGGNAAAQPAQQRSSAMQQQQQQDADAAAAPPEPRPTCENHDDGVTAALVLCEECGGLCAECDRVLHLSKRTRLHRRAVFRHHHQDIRVDLHEGCGRVKLWWLLALADANTLKAMLELRGPSEAGLAPSATGGGGIGSNGGPSSSGSSHSCCRKNQCTIESIAKDVDLRKFLKTLDCLFGCTPSHKRYTGRTFDLII